MHQSHVPKKRKPHVTFKNWLGQRAKRSKENRGPGFILFSMFWRIFEHTVLGKAAELAYYFLFSFMPLIIFFTALLGVMNLDAGQFSYFNQFIPPDVQGVISTFYGFIKGGPTTTMMITGLALSIYFSSAAIRSLMRSLDTAYNVKKGRNPIFQFILSLFFAVIFLAAIVVSLIMMVGGGAIVDLILRLLPELAEFAWIVNILRFALMILPLVGIFLLLYKFTPHRKIKFTHAIPGSIFSMIAWVIASMAFSFYVTHFGRYASLYGSLGTVIVLMLWLYITGVIFILGGELNGVLLERKAYLREKQLLDDGSDTDAAEPDNIDE